MSNEEVDQTSPENSHHHERQPDAESQQTYRLSRLADLYSMAIIRSLSFTKHSLQWDGETSQSVLLKNQSHITNTVPTFRSTNAVIIQGTPTLQSPCHREEAVGDTSHLPHCSWFLASDKVLNVQSANCTQAWTSRHIPPAGICAWGFMVGQIH